MPYLLLLNFYVLSYSKILNFRLNRYYNILFYQETIGSDTVVDDNVDSLQNIIDWLNKFPKQGEYIYK